MVHDMSMALFTRKRERTQTDLQNCRYQPHVSHAFHSSLPQFARLCQAFSVSTSREWGFWFSSVGDGARQETNPSSVRDRAAFCSRVRLAKALRAVVSAGLSTAGMSSTGTNLSRPRNASRWFKNSHLL